MGFKNLFCFSTEVWGGKACQWPKVFFYKYANWQESIFHKHVIGCRPFLEILPLNLCFFIEKRHFHMVKLILKYKNRLRRSKT